MPPHNIGTLEAFAVEFFVAWAVEVGFNEVTLRQQVDNTEVVQGWTRKDSRNLPTNKSFIPIADLLMRQDLDLELMYVFTKLNLVDPISRGVVTGTKRLRLPSLHPDFPEQASSSAVTTSTD